MSVVDRYGCCSYVAVTCVDGIAACSGSVVGCIVVVTHVTNSCGTDYGDGGGIVVGVGDIGAVTVVGISSVCVSGVDENGYIGEVIGVVVMCGVYD